MRSATPTLRACIDPEYRRWLSTVWSFLAFLFMANHGSWLPAQETGQNGIYRNQTMRAGDVQQATNVPSRLPPNPTTLPSPGNYPVVTASSITPLPVQTASHAAPSFNAPSPSASQLIPFKSSTERAGNKVDAPRSPWAATFSMLISLFLVVVLFMGVTLMIRKSQPKQFQKLPHEVIEVLGRTTMGPRQQLVVLRFGSKLILVSQQPGETQSLGEITDVAETHRLAGLCESQRPESITNSFRDVLRNVVQPKRRLTAE